MQKELNSLFSNMVYVFQVRPVRKTPSGEIIELDELDSKRIFGVVKGSFVKKQPYKDTFKVKELLPFEPKNKASN